MNDISVLTHDATDASAIAAIAQLSAQLQSLRRVALAVARPMDGAAFEDIVGELAGALDVSVVFVAIFADEAHGALRTLAVRLDGKSLRNFDYPLTGSPCAKVVGHEFRFVARGVAHEFQPGTLFAAKGMDSYAAYPLNDSAGAPLGLLVAMDRKPIAEGDATHAEAMLKVVAGRLAADIERGRTDEALRAAELERVEAGEALRRSEASYRAIFEAAEDAILIHDWDTVEIIDVNPKACERSGYTADELKKLSIADISSGVSPYTAEQAGRYVEMAKAGHCPPFDWHRRNKDGSLHWDEVRLKPATINGRKLLLVFTQDITERRERESALQRSEARLRATVEAAFDCVIGMDGEGRIVEFNAAAERVFGHRRIDVLGRLLADVIVPPQHREAHTHGLAHFHVGGRGPMVGRLVETTAVRADGTGFPVELAISVATVPEGSIFVGHLRDISARRAAETEHTALEAQLRQAQKMEAIGQLTGGIAHDFNNILTSVIGYLVLGQERAETLADATLVRQLGQAHLAAQRARDLIAQMLAFARRQRGERRALPLAPLVRQSLQLLRATMSSAIVLDGREVDGLADAIVPPVEADAVQIEQVLFNLCINARDAMRDAGHIRVGLAHGTQTGWRCASCGSAIEAGDWVSLSVTDDGSGIAPDVMERMFDPFYSTKEVGRGSGMGLAIVHGIVHDHGGHIRVDTRPGAGTSFSVVLPAARALAGGAPAQAEARAVPLQGRVLLVEDEAMVAAYLAELLGGWGLKVTLMRDPLAAVSWLQDGRNHADLLITDYTMPQMTGLQLARQAHLLLPALPIVLISGNASGFEVAHLERSGVRVALDKPLAPERLRAVLRELLASA